MAADRDYIIRQALEMFRTEGIKSVRMDDIAQQLGVSKRTLYEMFGDKDTLLYEALVCLGEQVHCCHDALADSARDVIEAMYLVLTDAMERTGENRRMSDALRKFHPAIWSRLSTENNALHREKLGERLRQGIEAGLFRSDINVELAISVLYATATALWTNPSVVIPEGMSERDALFQTLSCFFRGISTPRGEALIEKYREQYIK